MQKPNPLNTVLSFVGLAFKHFTAQLGILGGLCVLVGSFVFLGTQLGFWCLGVGMAMWLMGKSIDKTLAEEAKKAGEDDDDEDESPDLPLGTV